MNRISSQILAAMLVLNFSIWADTTANAEQSDAQGTAVLEGQLKDPLGNVATGLDNTISLTNVSSGKIYSGMVDPDGHYAIKNLPAGSYDLSLPIQCCLYRSYRQKGIAISPGQTLKVNLPLGWGNGFGEIGNDPDMLNNDLRRRSHYVDGPTPRTADGRPDLSGEWAPIRRAVAAGTALKGLAGEVAQGGGPPMKPWAQAIDQKIQAAMGPQKDGGPGIGGPQADCLPQTATPTRMGYAYEFIQTPTRLVQITGFLVPANREIYLDGRKHPNPDLWNPSWYGHSVGQWDGDTLVVDTVGFNDITPGYGVHTEALHVIERITRPSVGHLVVDITATDPKAWTGPFHEHRDYGLITGDEVLEWVCFNNDTHFGGSWEALVRKLMATAPIDPTGP